MSQLSIGTLGNLSDQPSERDIQALKGYIMQLTEQLRYVLGNLGDDNLSTELAEQVSQAAQALEFSRHLFDALGNYSTINQTSEMIGVAVGAVDGRISEIALTADGLVTRVSDAEGRVSQVEQTASSLSSRVSSAEGNASYAVQTANSLSSTVSGLNGRVSVLEQTDTSISAKLVNKVNGLEYAATFGPLLFNLNGMYFTRSGGLVGFIVMDNNEFSFIGSQPKVRMANAIGDSPEFTLETGTVMQPGNSSITAARMVVKANLLPASDGSYQLGGYGQRWKYMFCSESSLRTGSDRAFKRDIAPADALALLGKLRPVRYALKADELGQVRFGFIAQEVRDAIQGTQYENAAFFDDGGGEGNLGLMYGELIAVLVEGWQQHEAEIERQRAQIGQLEARLARLEALMEVDGK